MFPKTLLRIWLSNMYYKVLVETMYCSKYYRPIRITIKWKTYIYFFQLVLIFCKREKFQYLVPVNVEVYMITGQLRHVCCVLDSRLEVQIPVKVIVVVPWFVEYVVRNLRFYLKQYKPDVVQLYVYVFSSVLWYWLPFPRINDVRFVFYSHLFCRYFMINLYVICIH